MFYRLLGKLFFLFYICPSIANIVKYVLRFGANEASKALDEQIRKDRINRRREARENRANSRTE